MNPSTQPSALPDGVWQTLVAHALTLVDERFPGAAAASRFLMQLPA